MKRTCLVGVAMLLVLLTATSCGTATTPAPQAQPTQPPQAQPIVLKLADSLPASHIFTVSGGLYWANRVEELTGGKVKFEHYPAEQLGKAKDLLDLTQAGTADVAYIGPAYTAGKLPLCGVGELPGLFDSNVVASKAYQEVAQGILYETELKKFGIRPLIANLLAPYQALNTKKEVKSLSDMKGLKMRVGGGTIEQTAALIGAVPVSVTPPEMFEAIQRGVLDGSLISYTSAKQYKFEEIIKYGTVGANFGTFALIYCINENVWQQLPEDVRKVMAETAKEASVHMSEAIAAEEGKVIQQWEQQGKVLYRLSEAEQKEWGTALQPVCDQWVKDMEAKGLPAAQAFDEFQKALEKYK